MKSVFDSPRPSATGVLYDGSMLLVSAADGAGVFVFPDGVSRLEGAWDTESLQMKHA
jgi:hypothetical protein